MSLKIRVVISDDQSLDHRKELSDDGAIFAFLREHFLHWLESLSLIHKLSDGVLLIKRLLRKVQVCQISPANYTLILSDSSLKLVQVLSLSDTWRTLKSLYSVIDQL